MNGIKTTLEHVMHVAKTRGNVWGYAPAWLAPDGTWCLPPERTKNYQDTCHGAFWAGNMQAPSYQGNWDRGYARVSLPRPGGSMSVEKGWCPKRRRRYRSLTPAQRAAVLYAARVLKPNHFSCYGEWIEKPTIKKIQEVLSCP